MGDSHGATVILIDSNGHGRTLWDSEAISTDELRRYFPDTVSISFRKAVRWVIGG